MINERRKELNVKVDIRDSFLMLYTSWIVLFDWSFVPIQFGDDIRKDLRVIQEIISLIE